MMNTPRAIRSFAIRQYKKAYQIQKKVRGKNFTMHYRSKKANIQSIMVVARDYNKERGQFSFLKHIISSEKLPKVNNTVIITLDKLGRFYIHIPVPLEDRENQTSCNGQIVNCKNIYYML